MVSAPLPWMEPMVGWDFTVVRRSRHGWAVRLRADYSHTRGGPQVELVMTELWDLDLAKIFEVREASL